MGLLQALLKPEEQRRAGVSLNTFDSFLDYLVSGGGTAAGVKVTEETAMCFSAVYACVKVIAETVAMLPLHVYERLGDRGKKRAPTHPLYDMLHNKPNPEQTKFEFFETALGHVLTWGNFYAEKELKGTGRIRALWPLRPDKMSIYRGKDTELYYQYKQTLQNGEVIDKKFSRDQIWHLKGLSGDGVVGYSPIRQMREAIALGMATQEYGARFFSNDSRPGGILEHPGELKKEARDRIAESWATAHGPLSQKHRIAILEEGLKWVQVGMSAEDSQFIETRKFQLEEVARIYRLQLHKIQSLDRATFSNIEEQNIDFVTDCIMPWLVRTEQSIQAYLFSDTDRVTYFAEHLVTGLLRGDSAKRSDYYNKMFNVGAVSPNDIRELENMNPVDGGDEYFVQLNMIPLSTAGESPPKALPKDGTTPPDDDQTGLEGAQKTDTSITFRAARQNHIIKARKTLAGRYHRLFLDAAQRIVNREGIAVKKQVKKFLPPIIPVQNAGTPPQGGVTRALDDFMKWLRQFYDDMPDYIDRNMYGVITSYAEAMHDLTAGELGIDAEIDGEMRKFIDDFSDFYCGRHVASSLGQIDDLIKKTDPADLADALTKRMDEWAETRPGKIADRETVRESNAVVHETYRRNGVTKIKSVSSGEKSCPYCDNLDGKTIGIEENFLDQDQDFQPDGAGAPLHVRRPMKHPPYHGGCDCSIMAE